MIEFNYNKKKIIFFLIFSIILILFFGWTFMNAEILALREPKSSYRYKWVGKLFYKNETLIHCFSGIILLIFVFFIIRLIQMLIKKRMIFKIQNGKLYQDNKYLTEVNQITSLQLKSTNKNYFINIFLKNPKIFIENQRNFFKKTMFKIVNYTEKTPLSLNIDFLKNKPETIIEKLNQLIK